MAQISPSNLEFYQLNIYIVLLFYNPGLAFFKLSLLSFYVRVFPVVRWLRLSCYAIGSLIVAWVIATQFAFIFRCAPVSAAWMNIPGKCINPTSIFIAQSIPTLVFDIAILALPVRTIWGTQMKRPQRIGVIGVFLLGGLVTIISVVRLENTLTLTNEDFTCKFHEPALQFLTNKMKGLMLVLGFGQLLNLSLASSAVLYSPTDLFLSEHAEEWVLPPLATARLAAMIHTTQKVAVSTPL